MTSNCIFCGRVVSAHAKDFIRVEKDKDTFPAHELCAPPCAKCRNQILPRQMAVSLLTHQDGKRVNRTSSLPIIAGRRADQRVQFSPLR
jgi:hypothetical protein